MPLRLFIVSVILFFVAKAFAQEAVIFDVRRPVSLTPGKTHPQDFFINAGSEKGLKEGMLIVVNRRQTLYDSYQNKSPGDLIVPVAQIRIIHVQAGLSVARLEKMVDRKYLPTLEIDAVMIGDKLDMETAKMAPQNTASLEEGAIKAISVQPMEVLKAEVSESAEFSSTRPASSVTVTAPTL